LALGNAFGSNICNIALVLGLASVIRPITVQAQVLRRELPILALVTAIVGLLIWGGHLSRGESGLLLLLFSGLMFQSIRKATSDQHISTEENADFPLGKAWLWTLCGILVLFAGSRLLVWGSITLAQALGINDVVIGLTIVALGTSLPELAATVTAAWKGRHELALGNVLGSNLFNTLAVVGITGIIQPTTVPSAFLSRDILITGLLTASLFLVGYGFRGEGRINRLEGAALLAVYPVYNFLLLMS
jgi:cation:H+ antiporter